MAAALATIALLVLALKRTGVITPPPANLSIAPVNVVSTA
jgi:hypothetical protein